MIDKLSPKIAPELKPPATTAESSPADSINPQAIGAIAAMVPIDVPMAVDKNAATKNKPGNSK